MIREDEFVTLGNPSTQEQLWGLRSTYRRLPKKIKRKFDRPNIKAKQQLDFPTWWAFIGEGVRQGRMKFDLHATKPIDLDMTINSTIQELESEKGKNYDYLKVIDYYRNTNTPTRAQRFESKNGFIPRAPIQEPSTEEIVKAFVDKLPDVEPVVAPVEKPKRTRKKKEATE